MKSCPIEWNVECQNCPYCKDNLCDYPYIGSVICEMGNGEEN